MDPRRVARRAAAALPLLLLGAGCSSDRGLAPTPLTHEPGVLTVGICPQRPFAYEERGRLRGFEVELARAISREMELRVRILSSSCAEVARAWQDGGLDAMVAEGPTGAANDALLVSPHYVRRVALTVDTRVHPRISSFEDLPADAVVGVPLQGGALEWAGQHLSAVEIRPFETAGEAFDALAAGELDAVVDDEARSWAAIENRPGLQPMATAETGIVRALAVPEENARLDRSLGYALRRVVASGGYARAFAKYFPGAGIPPEIGAD